MVIVWFDLDKPHQTCFTRAMSTPSLAGQPSHIELTESQRWALNHALELEVGGWIGAASFLRRKHFPSLPWDDPTRPHGVATRKGFEAMLRLHHGSNPPLSDLTHAVHPAQHLTPTIRPDQITS